MLFYWQHAGVLPGMEIDLFRRRKADTKNDDGLQAGNPAGQVIPPAGKSGPAALSFQPASRPAPNGKPPLVEVRDLVKVYRTAAGDFTALKSVNLKIYPGEFVGIIGKSGAGKSTLLNMITGVDEVTTGEVIIDGLSIHQMSENQRASWRGRNLGIVYQSFQLLPMLSLVDNIILPMDFTGSYRVLSSRQRALELLRLVELEEHARKLPAYISGGQQQRVAIARALANDPPILVADEPTGSLDTSTADSIFDMFEQLVEQGKTIIMVTHDNSLAPRFTRRVHMADGEITSQG
jgi:putative ABC transport system ATP-binding protein